MNIFFLTDYYLPHAGGSRVYYHSLLKNVVARSADRITVLTKKVSGWEAFDRRETTEKFRIVRHFKPLPSYKLSQLPKIVFPFASAVQLVLENRFDLMHVGDLYPQGPVGIAAKRLLGLPYVAYCHGEDITQSARHRYQPLVRNKIYREASVVIAANEFARRLLLEIGIPEERVVKITPGVDLEQFAPKPPRADLIKQYGLQSKKVILTVARLWPRKGHDVVLKALAMILRERSDVHYVIVGTGPDEQRLRALAAELGITASVSFTGYVPDDQLPDFYHLADLFVMLNREEGNGDLEGFGMTFIEANAAGKAVVGGLSGGTAEAVLHGKTGLLIDPANVEQTAATLKSLIDNEEMCKELGAAGLRRARSEFAWQGKAELFRQVSAEVVRKASWKTGRLAVGPIAN